MKLNPEQAWALLRVSDPVLRRWTQDGPTGKPFTFRVGGSGNGESIGFFRDGREVKSAAFERFREFLDLWNDGIRDPNAFRNKGAKGSQAAVSHFLLSVYDWLTNHLEHAAAIAQASADLSQRATDAVTPPEPRGRSSAGQGFGLTPEQRMAVEQRAMVVAREGLIERGFRGSDIEDVSTAQSFDFLAMKGGRKWCVEVKGTTGSDLEEFLLTAAELRLHREQKGQTALALVADISLVSDGLQHRAMGGNLTLHMPWDVDAWDFEPTAFRARRR